MGWCTYVGVTVCMWLENKIPQPTLIWIYLPIASCFWKFCPCSTPCIYGLTPDALNKEGLQLENIVAKNTTLLGNGSGDFPSSVILSGMLLLKVNMWFMEMDGTLIKLMGETLDLLENLYYISWTLFSLDIWGSLWVMRRMFISGKMIGGVGILLLIYILVCIINLILMVLLLLLWFLPTPFRSLGTSIFVQT